MANIRLKGITWAHSRGITPLLAASQRFNELFPGVEIEWKKRTLQQFADYPVEELAANFDLLVIDHPWVGRASSSGCLLPLNIHLPQAFLRELQVHSAGLSWQSYLYDDNLWALPIDAATPVASYRADILEKHRVRLPATWKEVLELAEHGVVAVPGIPVDVLMNFYMFCIAHGQAPFMQQQQVVAEPVGLKALQSMRELYSLINPELFSLNPVGVAERMSNTDDYWYCPFAYGYSNYARKGYAPHTLTYCDLPEFKSGKKLRSTLGGTGLAIAAGCKEKELALAFAQMVASPQFQSTLYVENGGQPGHKLAWLSQPANVLCNNYFFNTWPALERSYLRPRYNGYLYFQDNAAIPLQHYLAGGGNPAAVLQQMNRLYRESFFEQPITEAV